MIGGQVNDLEGEGKFPTAQLLESIHRAKTGALLRASVRMGAIYAGAGEEQLEALTRFGEHVGLAFQIVDDVLDVEQSSEALGKTAGKDAQQHKITFPAVYGLERSREMAEEERLECAPGAGGLRRARRAPASSSPIASSGATHDGRCSSHASIKSWWSADWPIRAKKLAR